MMFDRRRRALDDHELAELIDAIRTTSRDPGLDMLLVRFHLGSGARRQGAVGLRLSNIDPRRSTVWLGEKIEDVRSADAHLSATGRPRP